MFIYLYILYVNVDIYETIEASMYIFPPLSAEAA